MKRDTVHDLLIHDIEKGIIDDFRKAVKLLDLQRDTLTKLHQWKNAVQMAKVYTFSEAFAMHTEDVSIDHIEQLPWFLASGKPSFPRMFLNDDTAARLSRGAERGVGMTGGQGHLNNDVAPAGYLVIDHGGWAEIVSSLDVSQHMDEKHEQVMTLPYSFAYAYEGELPADLLTRADAMADVVVSKLDLVATQSDNPSQLMLRWALGAMAARYKPMLEQLEKRAAVVPNIWGSLRYEMMKAEGQAELFRKNLTMLLAETAGSFRYVITAMAILNDIPLRVEERSGKTRGRTKSTGRSTPKKNDTVIYLNVLFRRSRKVTSNLVGKMLIAANRKRHPVRGHWMYFGRDDLCAGEGRCKWPLQHADRQECETCGCKRTFRKAHERGNIELGYVNKEYRV